MRRNLSGWEKLKYWLQITRSGYSSWSAVLGSVLGGIALCNLVFRFFRLSAFEALGWLLKAYRDTFHPPVAFIFAWLPFALPSTAKDLFLLYAAVGGVLYRSLSYQPPSEQRKYFPWSRRELKLWLRMRLGHFLGAVIWPTVLIGRLRKPCLLVKGPLGYHGRLPPMSRKDAEAFLAGQYGNPQVFCDERELIICYFIALAAAVFAVVVLNGAINELGVRSS